MSKTIRNLLVSLVCLSVFMLAVPFAAAADDIQPDAEEAILTIATAEDFLTFAEACRLDSYSVGLHVSLEADLDLSGLDYDPVPIFSGVFNGNGYTISGICLERDGSVQGLFRYLTEDAVVQNLTVKGDIQPAGSHNSVGGIAGSNAGRILDCRFEGFVSGGDNVGGIAGENTLTGLIDGCRVVGTVIGSHFVGGIAGDSAGVIRNCANAAGINTTAQHNTVDINDITLETITNTESIGTVTDIGGIAGISSGVIRDCVNRGNVGYQQMGYNIGGIAGTQKGYIFGSENFGSINGRKEVGGIAGQMEPVVRIEYTVDALQILRQQLDGMSGIANSASAHAQHGASAVGGQLGILSGQVNEAAQAVDKLLKDSGYDGGMPDPDTMQAIENTLAASMTDMRVTMSNLASATQNTMNTLAGDMRAISGQINAMTETLDQAEENMGIDFQDVSDEDTPEMLSGKVEKCINYGSVLADLNGGGIAGAIAPENDMNAYENILFSGEDSMNMDNEFRAVILSCDNKAGVTVKKQNGGGIVGWMSMGLARECMNIGTIDAENADFLGGIAGTGSGFIRNCYVSCTIFGDSNVGGIAGVGTIVSDCRSMVTLEGSEKIGGILGMAEEPTSVQEKPQDETTEETEPVEAKPVNGNFYVSLGRDIGAVDGISYAGSAEPLSMDAFMELEELPMEFGTVVVRFVYEDGTEKSISLVPGGKLKESQLPAVPEKSGFTARWSGLEKANLNQIVTDLVFEAEYTAKNSTIQSAEMRENGMPVVLAQGLFSGEQIVVLEQIADHPELSGGEEWAESWSFAFPNGGELTKLRYSIPPGSREDAIRLMVRTDSGAWTEREYTVEGSYVVFDVHEGDGAFCMINSPNLMLMLALCLGAVALIVVAILLRSRLRRK